MSPSHNFFGPVSQRFAQCPTFGEVVAQLLHSTLALQPDAASGPLSLPPDSLALGDSLWERNQAEPTFAGYRVWPVVQAVMERYLTNAPINLSAQSSFLTQQVGAEYPRHLRTNMQSVAQALDLAGALLIDTYCERLVGYWNRLDDSGESLWQWLASHLRKVATEAVRTSSIQDLAQDDRAPLLAALDTDTASEDASPAHAHVQVLPGTEPVPRLLISAGGAVPFWYVYDVTTGFKRFNELNGLIAFLGHSPSQPNAAQGFQGDVYETWASAILDRHLGHQRARAEQLRALKANWRTLDRVMNAFTAGWALDSSQHLRRIEVLHKHLPTWLTCASATDRLRYTLGLQQVFIAQRKEDLRPVLVDLPTPQEYARERLAALAALEHPEAPLSSVDDVVVHIFTREDDDLLSIAGGGGHIALKESSMSLVDLSLLNTGGRPKGWMHVSARTGTVLPAWLDDDAAIELVKAVNVGKTYLTLIHDSLLVGEQGAERRHTFKAMTTAQVPLMALELKLRNEKGFDERGLALVHDAFLPGSALPGPALSQLALRAGDDIPPDLIAGMFLLADPHVSDALVLYAPLSREPLRQFKDLTQLMGAVMSEPALQKFVLAWLSDTAQVRYRNGGLQSPRWLRFGQGDEFAPAPRVTPARAVSVPTSGNAVDAIYDGIAQALLLAADRQTVSDWESFWMSAREIGWVLFNQTLPLLSGPVANAAWLIQLGRVLDEQFNATAPGEAGEPLNTEELLLDVMLALANEAAFRTVLHTPAEAGSLTPHEPHEPHAIQPSALPSVVDTHWATPHAVLTPQLQARLEPWRVTAPASQAVVAPTGPLKGLVQDAGQWLAHVEGRWFKVAPGDGEAVVLDPATGDANGPRLRRDEAGRWRLDLRLRLRGGGPKRRLEQQRAVNQQRRERARACLLEIERVYRSEQARGLEGERQVNAALKAHDFATASTVRKQEMARIETAHANTHRLCLEYETIGSELALPEHAKELSVALSAEANMSGYCLALNRDMLLDLLNSDSELLPALRGDGHMTASQVHAWFRLLHQYINLAEVGITWRKRLDDSLARLAKVPVAGQRYLDKIMPKMATFRTMIEYRTLSLYTQLSLLEEPMIGDETMRQSVHESMKPLVLALQTHKSLTLNPAVAEGATSEVLDGVIHAYQAAEDTVEWLRQTLPPSYIGTGMGTLSSSIGTLREEAEAWLGQLIKAQAQSTPAPAVASSSVRASSGQRMIRTRHRGALVARVKPAASGSSEEVAEVVSPLGDAVIARFKQDTAQGDWVEQPVPRIPASATASGPVRLEQLAEDGDRMLENGQRQLGQAPRLAKATHIPVEIEELMLHTAQGLREHAGQIEDALTRLNETDLAVEGTHSAEVKAKALRTMATQLKNEGRRLRIQLTKTGLPTAARVRYLVEQNEASIERIGERTALKGKGKRKDIVQEYVVKAKDGVPLWYAHFHYATMDSAEEGYLAAHLKTVSQRFVGLGTQMAQAATNADVVKIYRSAIDRETARSLFLAQH